MRVAILVSGLPPEHNGGTEIATVDMAGAATREGHEVHILALDAVGGRRDGVTIHGLRTVQTRYLRGVVCIPDAVRTLNSIKPDLIHTQGIYMAPAAMLSSQILGIPYLYSERGSIYVPIPFKSLLYRAALNRASRIVAQTEHQMKELLKYTNRPVEVIPNGIDISRLGRISKQEARDCLGLPQRLPIILFVGQCRPEKNVAGFIEIALLDNTDSVYLVVGGGKQLGSLIGLSSGRVKFAGAVPATQIHAYMSAADVLVNTSTSEGFPVSVLEGMASGLPIIAPRVCGMPEIVTDGANGLLFGSGDYSAASALIHKVLDDPQRSITIGQQNIKKAGLYTWESIIKRLYA